MPLQLSRPAGIEGKKAAFLKLLGNPKKLEQAIDDLEKNNKGKKDNKGKERAAVLMKDLFESLSYSNITPELAEQNKELYNAIAKRWRADIRQDSKLDKQFKNDLEVIKKWRQGNLSEDASSILKSENLIQETVKVKTVEVAPVKSVPQEKKPARKQSDEVIVKIGNRDSIILMNADMTDKDFGLFVKQVESYAEKISNVPEKQQAKLIANLHGYANMPFADRKRDAERCQKDLDKDLSELAKPAKSQSTGFFSRFFYSKKEKSQNLERAGKVEVRSAPLSQQNPTPTPSKAGFFKNLFRRKSR